MKTIFQEQHFREASLKKNRHNQNCPDITPEFLENAKREYKKRGGVITVLNANDAGRGSIFNRADDSNEFLR